MKIKGLLFTVLLFIFFAAGAAAQLAVPAPARLDLDYALGNPSNSIADINQPDNFLVAHRGYALSYNRSRGAANWVAWHLEKADIGDVERTNAFAPDIVLSADWWIKPFDYAGSGYDRGHMCPSKDRSATEEDNRETFFMSNMQPQTPKLNQKTWKYLEDYTRETVGKDNEAYIYAGCYGSKGTIRSKITIPERCFKVIVVMAQGTDDLKRVDENTRVIAVDLPNDETVSVRWRTYLTTVDAIEEKTGLDFLSNVKKKIQKQIESKVDAQSTGGDAADTGETKPAADGAGTGDRKYFQGSRGGCYYLTASGRKKYVDRALCKNIFINPAAAQEDRKEDQKEETKKSGPTGREYFKGARGGCYYLTASGAKKYVDRNLCETAAPSGTKTPAETSEAEPEEKPETAPAKKSDGRTYFKGSRGGCYYLTASGRKKYVDRDLCN